MKTVLFNSKSYLFSRCRNGFFELVDPLDGRLLRVPASTDVTPLDSASLVSFPFLFFASRSPDYLRLLRDRRIAFLNTEKPKKARKAPAKSRVDKPKKEKKTRGKKAEVPGQMSWNEEWKKLCEQMVQEQKETNERVENSTN